MDFRFIYAIILSILPVSELRGGMPIAILFAKDYNIPLVLIFSTIILMNIIAIFIAFFFFDHIHEKLLKWKFYNKIFEHYIKRMQKKADKLEHKFSLIGFLALALFVAVPLPATGAWSGCLVSKILDLDRKKSILAISVGVLIAGILVFFGTLGFLSFFS